MRRREFITLLGGAVAWPLSASAEQQKRIRGIGVLHPFVDSDLEIRSWVNALKEALATLGWNDGIDVRINVRGGGGDLDQMRNFARELIDLHADVIVAITTRSVNATEHSRARAIIEQLQARNAELEQELEGVARQQPSTVEELTTQDIVAGFSLTEKDARIAELEAELADMGEKLNLAIRGLKERWGVATVLKWWGTAAEDERDEFLAELIAGELSQPEALKAARTLYAP